MPQTIILPNVLSENVQEDLLLNNRYIIKQMLPDSKFTQML